MAGRPASPPASAASPAAVDDARPRADRWSTWVGVVPAATAVVLWPAGDDPFLTPKATVAVLGVLGLLAGVLVVVLRQGRLPVPGRVLADPPVRWAVSTSLSAYVLALGAATLADDRPVLALVGHAGRHVGLATALATVAIMIAAIPAGRRDPSAALAPVLVAALAVVAYALLQAVGLDPVPWGLVEGGPPVFGTLGNTNFASGWLGMVAPLATWAALAAPWDPLARGWCAAIAAGALLAAGLSGSLQGLVPGTVAVLVVLVAARWLRVGASAGRRAGLVALALALAGSGLAVAVGIASAAARSLANRVELWGIAWEMAAEHPLRGVGLVGFRDRFPAYQAAESAAARGLDRVADSPHSVPLHLLVSGGWPLVLAWLAVVGAVALALIRGWRRHGPEGRLLLLALGAAGGAYLAQAAVSIDVVPLASTGALVGGLAVGAAGPDASADPGRPGRPRLVARIGAGLLLLLVAGAAVAATVPQRADLVASRARVVSQPEGTGPFRAAARIAWWEPSFAARLGGAHTAGGELAAGRAAHREAARRAPRAVAPQLNIARLSVALDEPEVADVAYERAVARHPRTAQVLDEAGRHALARGRPDEAATLLERALAASDDVPPRWRALADAYEARGDADEAAAARAEARSRE